METIEKEARHRELPFLLIGGHAVNLYGFARETADLDFLVCTDHRASWITLFIELGYNISNQASNFLQFASDQETAWPVDLMLVRPATFNPMFEASQSAELYSAQLRLPTLEHLIALKLHAIKHARPNRSFKDLMDVANLIRVNHLDIKSENIRRLFEKYAKLDLYEKIRAELEQQE